MKKPRTRNQVIADFRKMFPNVFVREGEEWSGQKAYSNQIWTGFGEASADDLRIMDYHNHRIHPKLKKYLMTTGRNVWFEWHDAGTLFFIVEPNFPVRSLLNREPPYYFSCVEDYR